MRVRVATSLVAIPLVLAAVFYANSWALFAVAVVATLVCSIELGSLLGGRPTPLPTGGFLALATVAVFLYREDWAEHARSFALQASGLFLAGVLAAFMLVKGDRSRLAVEVAALWFAAPLGLLVALHAGAGAAEGVWNWRSPVLMALVPIWAGDTFGLLAGKAWGKRPLAPKLSPKKTVVGAVANLIACVAAAWVMGVALSLPLGASLGCGLAAGVLGQAGDLFESALKRSAGKKDSGALLPGHGGMLDRIDSLLFAAPAIALMLLSQPAGNGP